jgi:hypothetical protein
MPDLEDGDSDAFEQGRVIGRQEERAKIKRIFHDPVSPELSAALLTLAHAEKELKAKHAPEADQLAQVRRLIDKAIEKIVTSLDHAKQLPHAEDAAERGGVGSVWLK